MNRFTQYFSGGQWHAASGAELLAVHNPASEEQVGMLRLCSTADVNAAVHSALRAFVLWSGSNPVQRKDALGRFTKAIEVRLQSFIASYALEAGCPVWCGRRLQGEMPLHLLEATLQGIDELRWNEDLRGSLVRREPVGVLAALCSVDAPLWQMVSRAAAAIAAGCSIVLKPASGAPGTVRLFCEALEECDLLPGLVNVLYGETEVAQALAAHADVAMLSITGPAETAHPLAAVAAGAGKRISLALGGKSAAVLLDDADLDAALPSVLQACMSHSGQDRAAQTRLIVPNTLIEPVCAALAEHLAAWRVGLPQDEATRIGPLATAERYMQADSAITAAIDEGAELVAGGPGRAAGFAAGHFVAPTVLLARPEMAIAQQELAGPVLCVLAHQSDADAVRIANATRYGLLGAVWTSDAARASAVAQRLRAGQVRVNSAPTNPAAPFGGFGASGHGREQGRFGIEALLETKVIEGLEWAG